MEDEELMRLKPIIFSTPMVQAILEKRKTQTRRVIKPQPGDHPDDEGYITSLVNRCPYGEPETVLWVRETWGIPIAMAGRVIFKADYPDGNAPLADGEKWRPAIHMPREAARIFLEVTNVRVERLQEITEEDARAEGVFPAEAHPHQHRDAFAALWDSINLKRGFGWETNPWVWVISFMRTEVDA